MPETVQNHHIEYMKHVQFTSKHILLNEAKKKKSPSMMIQHGSVMFFPCRPDFIVTTTCILHQEKETFVLSSSFPQSKEPVERSVQPGETQSSQRQNLLQVPDPMACNN